MAETPRDGDPIRDYIRANLHTHTPEAIRQQLIGAGHDPARVDAIWEEEWKGVTASTAESPLNKLAGFLFRVGAVGAVFGALLIVGLNLLAQANLAIFLSSYAVLYVAVGLGVRRLVRWGTGRFNVRGIWYPLMGLVLLPVFGALMFGGCLAAAYLAKIGA